MLFRQNLVRLGLCLCALSVFPSIASAHNALDLVPPSTGNTYSGPMLYPGVGPQSHTWTVPVPQAECTSFYAAHPALAAANPSAASAPCAHTETLTIKPTDPTKITGPASATRRMHDSSHGFFRPKVFVCPGAETPDFYCLEDLTLQACSNTPGGCNNRANTTYWTAQYNGHYVYVYGAVHAYSTSYWPYSQTITWTGTWNNGGQNSSYMNGGDDYTVDEFGQTFKNWHRINVGSGGNA